MRPEDCPKLDECYKVKMILDKDLLDFQYAEACRAVCANCSEVQAGQGTPRLKTRLFELYTGRYTDLPQLARAMGISIAQVYRVKQGKRPINEKFIIGAVKAFPGYKLDDLFYVGGRE